MSRFDSPIFHPVFADRRVEMKKAYEAYLDAVKEWRNDDSEAAEAKVSAAYAAFDALACEVNGW